MYASRRRSSANSDSPSELQNSIVATHPLRQANFELFPLRRVSSAAGEQNNEIFQGPSTQSSRSGAQAPDGWGLQYTRTPPSLSEPPESVYLSRESSWMLRSQTSSTTAGSDGDGPTLREMITAFGVPGSHSPTIQDLAKLQETLDMRCLDYSSYNETEHLLAAENEVSPVINVAKYLSGSLSEWVHSSTPLFQEQQLRTLISALALLHFQKVHTLNASLWAELRFERLFEQFRSLTVQRSSDESQRIRTAPSIYLIQLATRYISLFQRDESPFWRTIPPAINIIFAGISLVTIFLNSIHGAAELTPL